jgi:hypothetical protein
MPIGAADLRCLTSDCPVGRAAEMLPVWLSQSKLFLAIDANLTPNGTVIY